MKPKYCFCLLCTILILAGCSYYPDPSVENENTWADSGYITVGSGLTVQNTDDRLALLSNLDTLSADGLYYATWAIGNSRPYENSDGDSIDLYDAQLYLLLGEFPGDTDAQETMGKWLAAGKTNYEVLTEEEITCNGQAYTLITYNCTNEDNLYARGVSAFGICGDKALCIELTCQEGFTDDLKEIMIPFLNGCGFEKH